MQIDLVNLSDNKQVDIEQVKSYMPATTINNYIKHTDSEKLSALKHSIFESPSQVIMCINGGSSAINLVNGLKLTKNNGSEKVIIGGSDNDHILLLLSQQGFNVINGHNLSELNKEPSVTKQLIAVLTEEKIVFQHGEELEHEISGKILAGHLQILCAMHKKLKFKDRVLCIYDHNNDNKMLRYLANILKCNRVDEQIRALVVGEIANGSKEEFVEELKRKWLCPVVSIDAWHYLPNNECVIKKHQIEIDTYAGKDHRKMSL